MLARFFNARNLPFPVLTERLILRPYDIKRPSAILDVAADARQMRSGLFDKRGLLGDFTAFTGPSQKDGYWVFTYGMETGFDGKGYMTEAVKGLIPLFRDAVCAPGLKATVMHANKKSARVLDKAGFAVSATKPEYAEYILTF